MKVKTLRAHSNTYGDAYDKEPGDEYDHPEPRVLIDDGVVEEVKEKKGKSDGASGQGGGSGGAGTGSGGAA